jgi:hypothetical protein
MESGVQHKNEWGKQRGEIHENPHPMESLDFVDVFPVNIIIETLSGESQSILLYNSAKVVL